MTSSRDDVEMKSGRDEMSPLRQYSQRREREIGDGLVLCATQTVLLLLVDAKTWSTIWIGKSHDAKL